MRYEVCGAVHCTDIKIKHKEQELLVPRLVHLPFYKYQMKYAI